MARRRPAPGCPCGLGPSLAACCGRFLSGDTPAPTAELLMRSRFCAYASGDREHLRRTWHSSTRPASLTLQADLRWTGLEVVATSGGGLLDTEGTVAFRARGIVGSRPEVLEEVSRFVREDRRWVYLNALTGQRGASS